MIFDVIILAKTNIQIGQNLQTQVPRSDSFCPVWNDIKYYYSAFTETGATQTMKTNQKAELKQ